MSEEPQGRSPWYLTTSTRKSRAAALDRRGTGVLLLDPTNDMLVRAVDDGSAVPEGRESLAARIEGVLSDLLKLKNMTGGDFEIRVSTFLRKIGAHAFDMATPDGVIVIQHWEHKSPGEPAPIFRFDRRDGYWFDHFAAELERIWNSGIDWPVSMAHRLASGSRALVDDFGSYLFEALERSNGLFVTGVTRSHFIAEHYSLLEDLLRAGKPIRFLIVDPHSSAIDVLADRSYAALTEFLRRRDLGAAGGGGRPISTAGPCVSLCEVRPVPLFAQVSHVARRSEAEPHWSYNSALLLLVSRLLTLLRFSGRLRVCPDDFWGSASSHWT